MTSQPDIGILQFKLTLGGGGPRQLRVRLDKRLGCAATISSLETSFNRCTRVIRLCPPITAGVNLNEARKRKGEVWCGRDGNVDGVLSFAVIVSLNRQDGSYCFWAQSNRDCIS